MSLTWKRNLRWHDPGIRCAGGDPLSLGGLSETSELQLPLGLIVLSEPDTSSRRGGNRYFRISLRPTLANTVDMERTILRMESVAALQRLAPSRACLQPEVESRDSLELPSTDRLVATIPDLIFESTMKALVPLFQHLERSFPCLGVLCGSTGMGKSHAALVLAAVARTEYRRATLYLDCRCLQESTATIVEILTELDQLFYSAARTRKCLVVLDDLDRIAPNLVGGKEGDPGSQTQGVNPTAIYQSKLISDRILQLFEAVNKSSSVEVVVTCLSETSLNLSLSQYQTPIQIPMMNSKERHCYYYSLVEDCPLHDMENLPEQIFAQATEGYRPKDLEKVALRVQRKLALEKDYPTSLAEATRTVLDHFLPLSHMDLDKPKARDGLSWSEIGGLFEVKTKLEATLLRPVRYRAIYEQAKIRLPRGILLLGPSGCGKSAIVPALAEACKFPMIACRGPEILDRYIGASEAKIRELFKRAASVAPSILFLDELDALAPRRGSDHTGVTDRVVNQLLTFLDGVEDTSNATVYVIGATSRPDKIDPALLRPGRLEQHLFVGPPEKDDEWEDLVRKVSSGWNISEGCRDFLFSDQGMSDVLASLKKHPLVCPADIKAAMDTAQLNAVHRLLDTERPENITQVEIEVQDLKQALVGLRPCTNPDDARFLDEIYQRYNAKWKWLRKGGHKDVPKELKTTLR